MSGRSGRVKEEVLRYIRKALRKEGRKGGRGKCSSNKPVRFPSVECVRVVLAEVSCLHIKEVTEVLDGLGQGVALGHGKDCIEEIIHVGLENAL